MSFDTPMRDHQVPASSGSAYLPGRELRRVSSEELVGPAREVLIRHAGCDYRLRITRQGKLILTK
jgi:hemin uptake protein HemP